MLSALRCECVVAVSYCSTLYNYLTTLFLFKANEHVGCWTCGLLFGHLPFYIWSCHSYACFVLATQFSCNHRVFTLPYVTCWWTPLAVAFSFIL